MKLPVFLVFVIGAFLFSIEKAFPQQLSDEVQSMLSESDQKKLTKFDETSTKGDLILSKAGYPGDDNLLNSADPDSKLNKKYFTRRIEATDYYRVANGGKYTVYERNIKDFWKKYTGEHYKLENVKKAEVMASMQFQEAQQYRKDASKSPKLKDWLPLILKAEENEKKAILELQKVLFVYLNYPAQYNEAWFKTDTVTKKAEPKVAKTTVEPEVKPVTSVTTVVAPIDKPKTDIKKEEPKAQKPETKADSSIYSIVGVDEMQIDIFNRFLQKQYPKDYEKYIIDFTSIDYSNIQSLRNAWYNYKFGVLEDSTQYYAEHKEVSSPQDTSRQLAQTDTKVEGTQYQKDSKSAQADVKTKQNQNVSGTVGPTSVKPDISNQAIAKTSDKKTTTAGDVSETTSKTKTEPKSTTKAIPPDQKTVAGVTTSDSKRKPTNAATETNVIKETAKISEVSEPLATGFLYKVQIAACRVALDAATLSGIYNGKERITETIEDNWYKYTIGNFTTHNEARQLRDALSVPGAFVAAYLNGKRIKLTPSRTGEWIDESLPADIRPELIQFRVQIAASRNELSSGILKNIYSGTAEIIMVYEGNWYKYSILAGNTIGQALEMVKNTDVPGAFIVSYYNNQKINLLSAIRLTNR